jgi:hypothetical protein
MRLSEPWLELDDGKYVVDGDVLASKFGLTADELRSVMQAGRVVSVSETGVGPDAGRVRLTFRYGAALWRVMIEPDGTVSEDFELGRIAAARPAQER